MNIDPNNFITDEDREELRRTLNAPHLSRRLLPPAVLEYIENLEAHFILQGRMSELIRRKSLDLPLTHDVKPCQMVYMDIANTEAEENTP